MKMLQATELSAKFIETFGTLASLCRIKTLSAHSAHFGPLQGWDVGWEEGGGDSGPWRNKRHPGETKTNLTRVTSPPSARSLVRISPAVGGHQLPGRGRREGAKRGPPLTRCTTSTRSDNVERRGMEDESLEKTNRGIGCSEGFEKFRKQ